MTNEEEISRGNEARAIINNRLFRESMDMLKAEIIGRWGATPAEAKEAREWLWHHYQAALKFEEQLTTVLNTGKLAAEQKRRESIGDRIRSFVR